MSRYFTRTQAERLLPDIDRTLREIVDLKQTRDDADGELKRFTNRINMMGGSMVHPGEILKIRSRRDGATIELKQAVDRLESFGCLLKDFEKGLIDFPTLYRGEEVYLCWQQGEDRIDHWHGVTEGFSGRKQIDDEFLENHRDGTQ